MKPESTCTVSYYSILQNLIVLSSEPDTIIELSWNIYKHTISSWCPSNSFNKVKFKVSADSTLIKWIFYPLAATKRLLLFPKTTEEKYSLLLSYSKITVC